MEESKGMLSTQTTLIVFRAIESGIGLKAVAESTGLSVKQVRTINKKTASSDNLFVLLSPNYESVKRAIV